MPRVIRNLLRISVVALLPLLFGIRAPKARAQDGAIIRPGDSRLQLQRLAPFEAEYDQVGYQFLVRLSRTLGEHSRWSFLMMTDGPTGVGVDHVGHDAADLAFSYRRFAFGAYRSEYVDARVDDGVMEVRRMPLTATADTAPAYTRVTLDAPVFDGTFVYWVLGLLPLEQGLTASLGVWSLTTDGMAQRATPPFEIIGRGIHRDSDDKEIGCWVVSIHQGATEFRSCVTTSPPFLLWQEAQIDGASAERVITFRRLRPLP